MKDAVLITDPTLGSDPELFVIRKEDSAFIPALDLVYGTKSAPRPMLVEGYYVQEDNVLLEFNIPPAKTKKDFVDFLTSGFDQIKKMLPEEYLDIVVKSSHKFQPEQLLDARANVFGCDPDKNAWTGKFNNAPDIPEDGLRTAGGHIHIGYKRPNKALNRKIVQAMDLFLGVPSIVMDTDSDRRRLYGKAGAYRDKPYGPEYRTLSSFWVASPDLMGWAYDQTMKAVDFVNHGYEIPAPALIVNTINTSNAKDAAQLCKKFNITDII